MNSGCLNTIKIIWVKEQNVLVKPQKNPILGSIFGKRVSKVCVKLEQNILRLKENIEDLAPIGQYRPRTVYDPTAYRLCTDHEPYIIMSTCAIYVPTMFRLCSDHVPSVCRLCIVSADANVFDSSSAGSRVALCHARLRLNQCQRVWLYSDGYRV